VNLILGLDASEDAWRRIDRRVNTYPSLREFTAIGSGGSSFREAMVSAVEAVVGPAGALPVSQRCSTGARPLRGSGAERGRDGSGRQGRARPSPRRSALCARSCPAAGAGRARVCSPTLASPPPCPPLHPPGGRWISVTVGPVVVTSADDVLEVYTRMKTDARLRYFL
jgi:hypothetical protein